MNTFRPNEWTTYERRLLKFGVEAVPFSMDDKGKVEPMSKEEAKEVIDHDIKTFGKVRAANRQIKEHHDRLEREEKKDVEKTMDQKLKDLDKPENAEKSRDSMAKEWLKNIAKELGVDEKALSLGKASMALRDGKGRESWDLLLNGKTIDTLFADKNKFAQDDPDTANFKEVAPRSFDFTEKGFKARVLDLKEDIKAQNE